MVNKDLTQDMINSGIEIITRLDKIGEYSNAILWIYFPEYQSWKLTFTFAEIGEKGPKYYYNIIQKIILNNKNKITISLDDIYLSIPNSPLITSVASVINTGNKITNTRMVNMVINGHVIPDAHIYRITKTHGKK
jgi:hypothetical protein